MALWVKTEALKNLMPGNLSIHELEKETGIRARVWYNVLNLKTEYTGFYKADKLLTAVDRVYLLQSLEVFDKRLTMNHGLRGYKNGCRCAMCRERRREADWRIEKAAKL